MSCPHVDKHDRNFRRKTCPECRAAKERERYYANRVVILDRVKEYFRKRKRPCPFCSEPMKLKSTMCQKCYKIIGNL